MGPITRVSNLPARCFGSEIAIRQISGKISEILYLNKTVCPQTWWKESVTSYKEHRSESIFSTGTLEGNVAQDLLGCAR